jgi:hypothetical protein
VKCNRIARDDFQRWSLSDRIDQDDFAPEHPQVRDVTQLRNGCPMKHLFVVGAIFALLAAAQLAERRPANPAADSIHTIAAAFGDSSTLGKVLDRSCGDCHSNAIAPGWYTRIPPFSTVMQRGAREGRTAVNFANWMDYPREAQRALLAASCADAKSRRMPVSAYLRFRRDAKLTAADVETICGAAR